MRKTNLKYYFSVEGFTEQWYLEWLRQAINEDSQDYSVKFDCKKESNLVSRARRINVPYLTPIFHIFDYEGSEPEFAQRFHATLDQMREAEKKKAGITYILGYSNFTFELWMILHKMECNGPLAHRSQYLTPLNKAYGEDFADLRQYKREDAFKRILDKLSLDDVRQAVRRSERIMQRNKDSGYILQNYRGYKYYKENPSLTVGEVIGKILRKCKLM